jgi:hypothetical protein
MILAWKRGWEERRRWRESWTGPHDKPITLPDSLMSATNMTMTGRTTTVAEHLDALSRAYVELAFGIERHVEGTVDAYFGPPEIRDAAVARLSPTPDELLAQANALFDAVTMADLAPSRADYLAAQVQALVTTCRKLAGEEIPYREEVRLCFDIEPEKVADSVYEEAIAALSDALPGEGDVATRMIAWREQFEIPAETARSLIDVIADEVRRRTLAIVTLPETEAIEVSMVRDKPWSGYNWYLGECRSLIEINTDLPIRVNGLLDLICHEGYPGHHTEHAVKEQRLFRELGYGEHAIQLINTPECVISEGIATLAESMIFTPEEAAEWRSSALYAPLGLAVDPVREVQIGDAQRNLRSVAGNAALMLHEEGASQADVVEYLARYGLETPERARHRMRFIEDPLWRAYVFTYHVGRDLLGAWCDDGIANGASDLGPGMAATGSGRTDRFRRLLEEQVTPSAIRSQLDEQKAGGVVSRG